MKKDSEDYILDIGEMDTCTIRNKHYAIYHAGLFRMVDSDSGTIVDLSAEDYADLEPKYRIEIFEKAPPVDWDSDKSSEELGRRKVRMAVSEGCSCPPDNAHSYFRWLLYGTTKGAVGSFLDCILSKFED